MSRSALGENKIGDKIFAYPEQSKNILDANSEEYVYSFKHFSFIFNIDILLNSSSSILMCERFFRKMKKNKNTIITTTTIE